MNYHQKHLSACLIALAALFSTAPMGAWAAGTAPLLVASKSFAILAASDVTNAEMAGQPATKVTGDLGVSPNGSPTACTGFTNILCHPTGTGVVTGNVYLGTGSPAGPAQADAAQNVWSNLISQNCDYSFTGVTELVGLLLPDGLPSHPLNPGVYCFASGVTLTGILQLQNSSTPATDVWIFQIGSTLTTAVNSSVVFVGNGSQTCSGSPNVWWQVGSSATLFSGTKFIGNIIASGMIDLGTTTSLDGRAFASGPAGTAVTLDGSNTVTGCNASGGTTGGDNDGDNDNGDRNDKDKDHHDKDHHDKDKDHKGDSRHSFNDYGNSFGKDEHGDKK